MIPHLSPNSIDEGSCAPSNQCMAYFSSSRFHPDVNGDKSEIPGFTAFIHKLQTNRSFNLLH